MRHMQRRSAKGVNAVAEVDLFAPLSKLHWVDRNKLKANNWNPNKVSQDNMKLLVQSILTKWVDVAYRGAS